MRVGILGSGLMGARLLSCSLPMNKDDTELSSSGDGHRPSLVYAGGDAAAKEVAERLIKDVGFHPIDAGPLRMARHMEPFALLVARLAYETNESPAVAYTIRRFDEREN